VAEDPHKLVHDRLHPIGLAANSHNVFQHKADEPTALDHEDGPLQNSNKDFSFIIVKALFLALPCPRWAGRAGNKEVDGALERSQWQLQEVTQFTQMQHDVPQTHSHFLEMLCEVWTISMIQIINVDRVSSNFHAIERMATPMNAYAGRRHSDASAKGWQLFEVL
jgi:hypothetical protein